LPCSEWERVGPLRWDHQKSDEFEATLRLIWEVLTGGCESNLKFARLLTTPLRGDLIAASQRRVHDTFISATQRSIVFLFQIHLIRSIDRVDANVLFFVKEQFTDSLTSTYRSLHPNFRLSFI